MKRLRRVTESEVIAEFLKNEFYQEEFHQDREQFEDLVLAAQFDDEGGKRSASGACCFVAVVICGGNCLPTLNGGKSRLNRQDLERLSVFPRAQWRRVANGSFLLKDIVEAHQDHTLSRANTELHLEGAGTELSPA